MSFTNSDLNKQAQALEVTCLRTTKSYHLPTCYNNILRIYLNEKLNIYHHILERCAQMHIRADRSDCRADILKYLYFSSTITGTSHVPSTITLTKLYLST